MKPAAAARPRPAARPRRGAGDPPAPDPDAVAAFLAQLAAPRRAMCQALRRLILAADPRIQEHIQWGQPAVFWSGPMRPFAAQEYRRHIVAFHVRSKDGGVLLVFLHAGALDRQGLLTGEFADGRRLARFHSLAEVAAGAAALQRVLRAWLARVDGD